MSLGSPVTEPVVLIHSPIVLRHWFTYSIYMRASFSIAREHLYPVPIGSPSSILATIILSHTRPAQLRKAPASSWAFRAFSQYVLVISATSTASLSVEVCARGVGAWLGIPSDEVCARGADLMHTKHDASITNDMIKPPNNVLLFIYFLLASGPLDYCLLYNDSVRVQSPIHRQSRILWPNVFRRIINPNHVRAC
jgi:hypothetical protein